MTTLAALRQPPRRPTLATFVALAERLQDALTLVEPRHVISPGAHHAGPEPVRSLDVLAVLTPAPRVDRYPDADLELPLSRVPLLWV
jgi:hypothetical protein